MRIDFIKGFLPWILFFLLTGRNIHSFTIATIAALLCQLIMNRSFLKQKFIFEWATLLFFIFLLVFGVYFKHYFVIFYNNLLSNAALTIICFASLIIGKPFTEQYAKRHVAESYWKSPTFKKINIYLTLVWAIILLLSTISLATVYYFSADKFIFKDLLPTAFLAIAIIFTLYFPNYYKHKTLDIGGVDSIHGISHLHTAHLTNKQIAYRTIGKGEPIILLHGSNMNMHGWDPDLLKKLSSRYQLFLLDYPGIGKSLWDKHGFEVKDLALAVNEFITHLKLNPVAVVGYSLGGCVAQSLAIEDKSNNFALILIATIISGKNAIRAKTEIENIFRENETDPEQQGKKMMQVMFPKNQIASLVKKMRLIFISASLHGDLPDRILKHQDEATEKWYQDDETYSKLATVSNPTLIIAGEQDMVVPYKNAEILKNILTNSQLINFADGGHGIIYQYPEKIAAEILKFLGK